MREFQDFGSRLVEVLYSASCFVSFGAARPSIVCPGWLCCRAVETRQLAHRSLLHVSLDNRRLSCLRCICTKTVGFAADYGLIHGYRTPACLNTYSFVFRFTTGSFRKAKAT